MQLDKYLDIINHCCLFQNLSSTELKNLLSSVNYNIISTNKNKLLHKTNTICNNFIIILKGTLSLEIANIDTDKSVVIFTFSQSKLIGANTLFSDNSIYKVDIYCKTDCILMYIPKYEVISLCKNINFLENLLTHMSQKTQFLLDKISFISNYNLRESIRKFIIDKYKQCNTDTIDIGMTKTELAKLMGVERTSLSRELCAMRNDNLIDFTRTSINIINLDYFDF